MRSNSYFSVAKLVLIVVIPIVLLRLPAAFFDNGKSLCVSRLLFNIECLACGMTRACMHLIHFQFEEAFAYNMMSFIVLPLVGVLWIKWGLKEFFFLFPRLRLFLSKYFLEDDFK
jgi:hypothetical protein